MFVEEMNNKFMHISRAQLFLCVHFFAWGTLPKNRINTFLATG